MADYNKFKYDRANFSFSPTTRPVSFEMKEGEKIVCVEKIDGKIYVFTSLRVFQSTNTPIENLDFIDVTEDLYNG